MARFVQADNDYSVLDTETNERRWAIMLPIEYVHLSNNELAATNGDTLLMFTPITRLPDIRDTTPGGAEQQRRVVVEHRRLETGHPFLVVVAVQAAEGSTEYVDCIIDQNG